MNPDSSVISIVPVYPVNTIIGVIYLSPLLKVFLSPLLRPLLKVVMSEIELVWGIQKALLSIVPVYPVNTIIGGISLSPLLKVFLSPLLCLPLKVVLSEIELVW